VPEKEGGGGGYQEKEVWKGKQRECMATGVQSAKNSEISPSLYISKIREQRRKQRHWHGGREIQNIVISERKISSP